VGHLAVQIAKARGAYVIGTASAPRHDFVRNLGADEVIDYATTDVAQAVRDVDVALDPIGGDSLLRSLASVRPGGILISLLGGSPELAQHAAARGVRLAMMLVEADHAGMVALAGLVDAGTLRPTIAGMFPLAEAGKAHALGDTGHTAGKLVLVVR
jgi:NADPH:quinone reductase-like Zn-dependent oxidoreductase